MKNIYSDKYMKWAMRHPLSKSFPVEGCGGMYMVPYKTLNGIVHLKVLVGCGNGWDHISVSLSKRCPTWQEMSFIKSLFFEDDETVMQLHVPSGDHINIHDNCLHLWRPHDLQIPLPPSVMV